MATRSTIKDWFVNHTKLIQKAMNTLDHSDVVSMPVMPIHWNSVSQEALTWTMHPFSYNLYKFLMDSNIKCYIAIS